MTTDLHKLARAMCSIDLAESQWTQELPRLPVPDLWLTVSRYLASLKSVLAPANSLEEMLEEGKQIGCKLTREQIEVNWRQYEHTDRLVRMFMLNEGPELQRDLKEYANKCQNWATDYWLQDMYLSNPLPLPVNSNPFFLFPRQKFDSSTEMLMFATRIIQFSVDFKFRIDQQALRQDYGKGHGKGKALCMETYKNFFHSYRMPHERMDRLLPQSRRSNHIVVASCNQFYILRLGQEPLDDPYRLDASSQLNESSIFEQLLRIYRVSREHARRERNCSTTTTTTTTTATATTIKEHSRIPKVGLFTSENRKQWARIHKQLSHCSSATTSANATLEASASSKLPPPLCSSGANSPNTNTDSLRQIEDCLFVMCLDSLIDPIRGARKSGSGSSGNSKESDNQTGSGSDVYAANVILTGGGTHLFTANRWFDKFLQIIVGRDGICGINIEHSASEGITVLRFVEEFFQFIKCNPIELGSSNSKFSYAHAQVAAALACSPQTTTLLTGIPSNSGGGGGGDNNNNSGASATNCSSSITSPGYIEPESPSALLEDCDNITPLMWHLNDELKQAIEGAELRVNKLIEDFDLIVLKFDQFGRQFIKGQNLSPDAFIQLAMQLTFYKLHGFLVSTYESASLRQFRLGRVDNIRANTCEAYQWIQAMLFAGAGAAAAAGAGASKPETDCNDTKATKTTAAAAEAVAAAPARTAGLFKGAEGAFIRAITKQVEILRYTIHGSGPDNHLLALRELAKIRYGFDDELPDLFQDTSYREFNNFRLSTSQLPNESGILVGYGAVVPDGYGCSYNPCEDRIVFCISSFNECPLTSSALFAKTLEESLLEMQQLCLDQHGKSS